MSDTVEMTNPVEQSVGGMSGHILRRGIHLSMSLIPLVYFKWGQDIAEMFSLTLPQLVSSVVLLLILAEATRLKLGITIFGQRAYEAKQVSALAWGALAVGIVFLMAPIPQYAWPLILSLSLGDPLMGELRRKGLNDKNVMIYSSLALIAVWLACWHFVATPMWLAFIFGPLCMISEWPRLRWIDDNATMLLIPLVGILLVEPFIGLM